MFGHLGLRLRPKWRDGTLDETANDNQDGATRAYFAFACFTVAWVVAIGNGETRSESWGRFF
jgi:hypothetical protein